MIHKLLKLKSDMLSDQYDPLWPKLTEEEWERVILKVEEVFGTKSRELEHEYAHGYDNGWEAASEEAYRDGFDQATREANKIIEQAVETLRGW